MVRLKNRYILFEILYPTTPDNEQKLPRPLNSSVPKAKDYSRLNSILSLHRSSPNEITQKVILDLIRKSLEVYFGDFGSGVSSSTLQIKYFSNKTSNGIIKISRDYHRYANLCLTLINNILGYDVIIRVIKVSGTIKKSEECLVERNKIYMKNLLEMNRNSNSGNIVTLFNE
ncbi:RNA-binding protein POP5 ASCRUDRAFT_31736 [Ascoidea rubescens DSM 1968]|uniref:Ribonuclease P/MRP protein subunit POP5 n=1 Tax=Ascoidea rubescens DSM 1968 TaxID=1344418 RepID=A0A1D2VN09_9ASCO|nr:hypothetical protein ASCRUDRAFT_31736 [Ascoidea rubescens DSM 1968]ODV62979.1 hypothetical protein ASCRUDRAFT_31736 [Ascoidea rubescens DSM 1968]